MLSPLPPIFLAPPPTFLTFSRPLPHRPRRPRRPRSSSPSSPSSPSTSTSSTSSPSPSSPSPPSPSPLLASLSDFLVALALAPLHTWKTHSQLRAPPLYKPFAAAFPAAALASLDTLAFVAFYRLARAALSDAPPPHAAVLSGAAACAAATALTAPLELAVVRIRAGRALGVGPALRGARGLYAGAGATLARDLPFDALEFAVFEALQRLGRRAGWREGVRESFVFGCVTGALVGAAVAPMDLVVSRVLAEPGVYRGVVGCVKRVMREEGVRGMLKGVREKMVTEALSSGLFFGVYEGGKGAWATLRDGADDRERLRISRL